MIARAFRRYLTKAVALILHHNYLSGILDPSIEAIMVIKRSIDVGKILGINVLDYIIFG